MKMDKECCICKEKISEYYWENIVKGVCSEECKEEYLTSEGLN